MLISPDRLPSIKIKQTKTQNKQTNKQASKQTDKQTNKTNKQTNNKTLHVKPFQIKTKTKAKAPRRASPTAETPGPQAAPTVLMTDLVTSSAQVVGIGRSMAHSPMSVDLTGPLCLKDILFLLHTL